jgi:hypothetical protein
MGYKVKRFSYYRQKEYGMGDSIVNGVRDVTGNVVGGVGKVVDSTPAKLAAGAAGTYYGAGAGASLGASLLGPAGWVLGGLGGALLGGSAGSTVTGAVGKTLKEVGQDIHS